MHIVRQKRFKQAIADGVLGSGYVVECLETALWAFFYHHNFRNAFLAATNLGHDADTTAAVCGQLAKAFYGMRTSHQKSRSN